MTGHHALKRTQLRCLLLGHRLVQWESATWCGRCKLTDRGTYLRVIPLGDDPA